MVREFIDRNWESLRTELAAGEGRYPKADALVTVDRIKAEWYEIPLEEKQIPYQRGEREFWFALYALETLLRPEKMRNAQGEPVPPDSPVWQLFVRDLTVAEEAMRDRGSLPEGCNARRPLP